MHRPSSGQTGLSWSSLTQNNLIQPTIRATRPVRPYGKKAAHPLLNRHKSHPLPTSASASHQLTTSADFDRVHTHISVCLYSIICCSSLSPQISSFSLDSTKQKQLNKLKSYKKKNDITGLGMPFCPLPYSHTPLISFFLHLSWWVLSESCQRICVSSFTAPLLPPKGAACASLTSESLP